MPQPGLLVVISSPSGVGKDSVIRGLLKFFPKSKRFVTTTTREPRLNEKEGVDYHFMKKTLFEEKINQGEFIEYNYFVDHYYGTPKQQLLESLANNPLTLLRIDVHGKKNLDRAQIPHLSIFLLPDNTQHLIERLKKRGGLTDEEINKRSHIAQEEIANASAYDIQIVNHEGKLDQTIAEIAEIITTHLNN
jgi:guanylate kinase